MDKLSQARSGRYHHGDLERALVAAALDLITAEGVEALTLRRVGATLGVSRTALYRHFDNKAALVARIASDGFRLLHDTMTRVLANASADAGDTLQVMAAAHVHFAQANPAYYATMFGGFVKDGRTHSDVARSAEAAFGQLVNAIRDAQTRGHVAKGDPLPLAHVIWALTVGIAKLGASGQHTTPLRNLEELAVLGVRWVSDGCLTPS